jgi:hypothetical protein
MQLEGFQPTPRKIQIFRDCWAGNMRENELLAIAMKKNCQPISVE